MGHTQVLLVRFLHRQGIIGHAFLLGMGLWFLAYRAGLVKISQESRARSAIALRGLGVSEVRSLMASFADEVMMQRMHDGAASALRDHQVRGDRVVVLSGALDPMVEALCERIGVSEYLGAPCEIEDGRFTGRLAGEMPFGDAKARFAGKMMTDWGVDPDLCWAYADHETDLQLLRSVGHPVAVHPKKGLLEVAPSIGLDRASLIVHQS